MGVSQVVWRFSFSLFRTQGDLSGREDRAHPRQTQLCLRRPQQEAGALEPLQFLLCGADLRPGGGLQADPEIEPRLEPV